ncbi:MULTISPECIES: hypothetical protein [Sphingobium]|uniref:hypothetical protein n=1 Tax=Sphingobium TaxID=165695 RepID=UPI001F29C031|nr:MULTISPECIES: hypothetical protein [Sphingobium]
MRNGTHYESNNKARDDCSDQGRVVRHKRPSLSAGGAFIASTGSISYFHSATASMAADNKAPAAPSPANTVGMNHHGGRRLLRRDRLRTIKKSPVLTI